MNVLRLINQLIGIETLRLTIRIWFYDVFSKAGYGFNSFFFFFNLFQKEVKCNKWVFAFVWQINRWGSLGAQAVSILKLCSDLCLIVFVGWVWGMVQWTQSFIWHGRTWQNGTKIFNFYLFSIFLLLLDLCGNTF